MIGIIGAMAVEVEEILNKMEGKETDTVCGLQYCRGTLHGVPCVTAKCGPGKVNAALCAQTMLLRYQPRLVINIGVAGGVGTDIKIGDMVLADGTVQHDVDTTAIGDAPGMISGINLVVVPTSSRINDILIKAANICNYEGGVHKGIIASGDQFIGSHEKLHEISEKFGASACEMESGSIAQVCYINGVECAVMRCISDHADSDAGTDFIKFATYAAHRTTDILYEAMPHLEA